MRGALLAALYELPLIFVPPQAAPPVRQEESVLLSVANNPQFSHEFSLRSEKEFVRVGENVYYAYRLDPRVPEEDPEHLEDNRTWLITTPEGTIVNDAETVYRASFTAQWEIQRADLLHMVNDQKEGLADLRKTSATTESVLAAAPFASSQLFGLLGLSPLKGFPSLPEAAVDAVKSAILGEMTHQIRLARGKGMDSAHVFREAMYATLDHAQEELVLLEKDMHDAHSYEEYVFLADRLIRVQTSRHSALTALASYFADPTPWTFLTEQVITPAIAGVASVDLEPWFAAWEPALSVYFRDATQAERLYTARYAPEGVRAGADRVRDVLARVEKDSHVEAALESLAHASLQCNIL